MSARCTGEITRIQNEWCLQGQRVIVLCKRECKERQLFEMSTCEQEKFVNECNDFCFIGMLGIIDPPRSGISDVIHKCRQAGIRVLMVTGDYALTAAAIAAEIGIFTKQKFSTVQDVHSKYKLGEQVDSSKKGNLCCFFGVLGLCWPH